MTGLKSRAVLLAAVAILAGAAGSAKAQAVTPAGGTASGPASDVAAIRAAGRKWKELYVAGRFSEIPELYTEDTVVMPRGRPRIDGREQMRRAVGGLAAGRRVDIEMTEREIHAVGNHGWFIGDFRVTYTPTAPGAAPITEYGRSLIIFRRDRDGRWRVHRDVDSPAPAPGAATTARVQSLGGAAPPIWDPASRTEATQCDRLASSRYDRTRLAPPVTRDSIDVSATIAQCEADLVAHPNDARIHFHLGRLYGYAGDAEKTLAHRRAAAAAGNHNAIFLLGYLAWTAAKTDAERCAAARDMKLAADRGNYSGQITYAALFVEGRLTPCRDAASKAEVAAYLASAKPAVDGFFETRLAEHLAWGLEAQPSSKASAP